MAHPLRRTMVYLGLADEDYDEPQAAAQQAPTPVASASRAPVTPLRRPTAVARPVHAELNEILTVHPRQYRDARAIAESFREGVPVIINLGQMSDGDARRLIDFASGLSQGLHGTIERVTSKVFLLSPQHIAVSGQESETESEVDAALFAR